MSDLTVINNTDELLAQLAAEFDIETEIPQVSNSRVYTNFSTLPDIRVLKSSWQGAKTLEWNFPGQEDIESFGRNFPYVNEIEGFIIHSEIQAGLQIENNEEDSNRKTKTLCSVVGYKKGNDYIRELPDRVPFNSMYGDWDTSANKPVYTSPNKALKELGWLGSRGKSCFDCITSGDSTKDWQGNEVKGECKLRGRIFFYVTHLISYFKEGTKIEKEVKSIQELMGEPGFVLMINLPTATGLKGKYDKAENSLIKKGNLKLKDAEKTRQCYLGYLTSLYYAYKNSSPNKVDPKFVCTNISIKPPIPGETQPKNYLTFEEVYQYDFELLRTAFSKGRWNFPNHSSIKTATPEILDSSNWVINGVGGSTVYSSAKVDDSNDFPMIEAATTGLLHSPSWKTEDLSMIEDAMVSDDESDADIPF
jgi:hypothetical protein